MTHQIPIKAILEELKEFDAYLPDAGERWMKAQCPFHDDRNASASMSETGFNCHACGVRGDAISLIILREGGDYASALSRAAAILGKSTEELSGTTEFGSRRRGVLDDDKGPIRGQRSLFSARRRRRPVAGA